MPYPTGLLPRTHGLTRLAQQVLPVLYQHRLMTTSQLHRLLQPHAKWPVYLRRQLALLRELGLASATVRHRGGQGELAWYCSPLGAEIVEAAGEVTARAYRMSEQAAASQLQEHTLAVNDAGLAFVEAARRLGHDCGPLDWEPELAHRLRDGESRLGDDAFMIPDAVLSYVHHDAGQQQRRLLTFFVEIDRATEATAKLAGKLRAYARYQEYVPSPVSARTRGGATAAGREAWRDRYPAFPRVLIILTGAHPTALARRIADLRALAAADTRLRRAAGQLTAGVTTLHQLQAAGPFARIVTPIFGDLERSDVLLGTRTG